MAEEAFNLDRETNIENLIDALGKKWTIHANKQTGLCYARPEPDRTDSVIPDSFQGLWTKSSILKPLIQIYVTKTWDQADKATAEAARAKQAAKEMKERAYIEQTAEEQLASKAPKVKNDKRSANK